MAGARMIVTGATSGIGLETARELARRGVRLVLACRNLEKAAPIRDELNRLGAPTTEVVHLDLASLDSVRSCAAELIARDEPVHVLVNNAGVFAMKREETRDGFELTMGVNHLGPFLLTNLLVPLLRRTPGSRIVNVASAAYRYGSIRLTDLQRTRWRGGVGWGGFQAYAASRLATVLFTRELSRRLAGTGVTVNACHPGHVQTNIFPEVPGLMGAVMRLTARGRISAAQGAEPVVRLATDPELEDVSGVYFNRFDREEVPASVAKPDVARGLWEISAQLTGLEM